MNFLEQITEKQSNAENVIDMVKSDGLPLIMYGCGVAAEYVYNFLLENGAVLSGVFVDADFAGQDKVFHGIKVENIENICKKYRKFNIIVGFLGANAAVVSLKKHYKEICNVYDPDIISKAFGRKPLSRNFIAENENAFEYTYDSLFDEKSKESYLAYLNGNIDYYSSYEKRVLLAENNQYFPEDIIKLTKNEVFIDCGAYTGDTIISFMNVLKNSTGCNYKMIYALEPDKANFIKLTETTKEIPRIRRINKGVWNKEETLRFSVNENSKSSSALTETGMDTVYVDSLDNIIDLQNPAVTFIKMDIEGAELNALKGAEQTIIRDKPKIAVCVYHKNDDLITIPQYIKSLVPEYKLFFRLHSIELIEAVLYAIRDV